VFVSNLPYTATSIDLQTLFSDIAPIKTAFVVLDKETKISKGVGYVTFAIKEDAGKCVQDGNVMLNGRTLRVSWAGQKVRTLTLLNINVAQRRNLCLPNSAMP
jgi:nucleolar protein 4